LILMPTDVITTWCASCKKEGPRDKFVWMAHLDFCADCMRSFVLQGWAVRKGRVQYTCTPEGVRRFPGLEVVSHCPRDGMPIYRRWIESGISTEVACPYCMSREAEMSKDHGLGA
jgi:hypothetical protein